MLVSVLPLFLNLLIPLLYNAAISDLDTYVSIQDLLNAAFCALSVNTNLAYCRAEDDVGRYMYALQLAHLLLVTLKQEERMNRNESAEEMKIEAVEESAVENLLTAREMVQAREKGNRFEELLTNMAPMASTQYKNDPANFAHRAAPGTPHYQAAPTPPPRTPPTRTPPMTPQHNMPSETEYQNRRISETEYLPPPHTPPSHTPPRT